MNKRWVNISCRQHDTSSWELIVWRDQLWRKDTHKWKRLMFRILVERLKMKEILRKGRWGTLIREKSRFYNHLVKFSVEGNLFGFESKQIQWLVTLKNKKEKEKFSNLYKSIFKIYSRIWFFNKNFTIVSNCNRGKMCIGD